MMAHSKIMYNKIFVDIDVFGKNKTVQKISG